MEPRTRNLRRDIRRATAMEDREDRYLLTNAPDDRMQPTLMDHMEINHDHRLRVLHYTLLELWRQHYWEHSRAGGDPEWVDAGHMFPQGWWEATAYAIDQAERHPHIEYQTVCFADDHLPAGWRVQYRRRSWVNSDDDPRSVVVSA
jgi:hypothetical protein